MRTLRIALVSLLILVVTGSVQSATIRVPEDYPTIQAGIDAAEKDDVVLVADGTYVENLNFLGKAITVESASGNPALCIVYGNKREPVVTFGSGEGAGSVLRGFRIQDGGGDEGGGILCSRSSPTIANNIIAKNGAYYYGGGIRCTDNSSPIIINNVISQNNARYGGGIHCTGNSSPIICHNTIMGNRADETGSGIYCYTSSATIVNTILWNYALSEIHQSHSSIEVTYSVVRGGYPGVGNINEYPHFVGLDDYHLSDYSPCIGAGIMMEDVPDTDIEGNTRPNPVGSAPDIGAYENRLGQPLAHPTTTIHVSTSGSDDTGDGSLGNPYLTIQKGINEAFDGDTVLVADGTYVENLDFHGKAIAVESASGNPDSCIIDGGGKDHVVIFGTYEEADSVLRGFTIQNGGQGVYCRYSSPTIARNIITGNWVGSSRWTISNDLGFLDFRPSPTDQYLV